MKTIPYYLFSVSLFVFCACESPTHSSSLTTPNQASSSTRQPNEKQNHTNATTTVIKKEQMQSNANVEANISFSAKGEYHQTKEVVTTHTTTSSANLPSPQVDPKQYVWLPNDQPNNALMHRILPPKTYIRKESNQPTFAHWLRHLPLKTGNPDVYLYNGRKKGNQNAHYAVVNIDVGKRDLQQCADAIMRLRAEYLRANQQEDRIQFNFTSGDAAKYSEWKKGYRPIIKGNKVHWTKQKSSDHSYAGFKQYMEKVFNYAGTFSLSQELKPVSNCSNIQAGDVFIQGGFPGHAVIVIDVVEQENTGEKAFLLAQSYMPAQDIHILNNPNNWAGSPWYKVNDHQQTLQTPEWTFNTTDLKRF